MVLSMAGSSPGSAFCLHAGIICMTPALVWPSQNTDYRVSFSEPRLGDGVTAMEGVTSSPSDSYGLRDVLSCCFLAVLGSSPRLSSQLCLLGFDATHPLMSSITTSLDPKHRGQITGLATFANFLEMGVGALFFQHLIAFGFSTALAIFGSAQTLSGFAALYGFRGERPGESDPLNSTQPNQFHLAAKELGRGSWFKTRQTLQRKVVSFYFPTG
jgi:hypothetical protein